MLKSLITSNLTIPYGLEIIRIISGAIIFSFGLEILDPENMDGYTTWLTDVGMPFPKLMAYIGKISELIGGICFMLGCFTRIAAIPLVITMFVITFIMSEGHIRSDTFYLLMIFASFFFWGSGKISIDQLLKNKF